MALTVRTHPFAAHSARLMQSTYRSIAGGLVHTPIDTQETTTSSQECDALTALLGHMRKMATGPQSRDNDRNARSIFDSARAMFQAIRARVGHQESRLEAGLATALEHAYSPPTETDWDELDTHMDEFRFDVG